MDQNQRFQPGDFGIGRLFRAMRDGAVVASALHERIVLWNKCAENIFGYSETEALQLPLHELVPEVLRENHRTGLARYQETGHGNLIDTGTAVELVGLHKNGSEVPIELTLTPIEERSEDGSRFVLAVVRDISDRKVAESARLHLREEQLNRREALELNDSVVQGLATAKLALEMGDNALALRVLEQTLTTARSHVGSLMSSMSEEEGLRPGDLVRDDQGHEPAPEP